MEADLENQRHLWKTSLNNSLPAEPYRTSETQIEQSDNQSMYLCSALDFRLGFEAGVTETTWNIFNATRCNLHTCVPCVPWWSFFSDIVDIKPTNMEDLTEVITAAEFHPQHCHLFVYSSSKGTLRLCDMRASALCDRHTKRERCFVTVKCVYLLG